MSLFTKIFGTSSQREVKAITPLVDKIESLEEGVQGPDRPAAAGQDPRI